MTTIGATKLTSSGRRKSSAEVSSSGPGTPIPALLTRPQSRPPESATRTSAGSARDRGPSTESLSRYAMVQNSASLWRCSAPRALTWISQGREQVVPTSCGIAKEPRYRALQRSRVAEIKIVGVPSSGMNRAPGILAARISGAGELYTAKELRISGNYDGG